MIFLYESVYLASPNEFEADTHPKLFVQLSYRLFRI